MQYLDINHSIMMPGTAILVMVLLLCKYSPLTGGNKASRTLVKGAHLSITKVSELEFFVTHARASPLPIKI